jgi:hypothetical protein
MKLRSKEYPESHLLNPAFVYVPAANTDIRKTFMRERERLERERQNERERRIKVRLLPIEVQR